MTRWGKCLAMALILAVAIAGTASAKDALVFGESLSKPNPMTNTTTVIVPLDISNTKDLAAIDLPLKFGNPGDGIDLLDVNFEEGRAHYFDVKVANIDNDNKTVIIGLLWMAYGPDKTELKSGNGRLATLTFEVTDPEITEINLEPTEFTNPSHSVSFIYNEMGSDGLLHVNQLTPELVGGKAPVAAGVPQVPTEWALNQNYPNPFNASTLISFALPEPTYVRLDVYNILGQKVATLKDEYMDAGYHNVTWNDDSNASGMYFYRLKTDKFTQTRKMTLLK
jgi:hypothetical protein